MFGHNGLASCVNLHGKFEQEWRVIQPDGFFLESGELDGVIECGHVHKNRDSTLAIGSACL